MRDADLARMLWAALSLFALCMPVLRAQTSMETEIGSPLIEYINTSEKGLQAQNFCACIDHRGVMYFGNQSGLIEYDGIHWQAIDTPSAVPVFSMDRGSNGVLYVGGYEFFGYLDIDANGKLHIALLSDSLPSEQKEFSYVIETFVLGSTVWFCTPEGIYFWDGKTCGLIKSEEDAPLRRCFAVNGRIYARMQGKGLAVVSGGMLRLLPGSERFEDEDESLLIMRALGEQRILVGWRLAGAYVFDGSTWMPAWDIPSIIPSDLYLGGGCTLSDGTMALRSGNNGVWIIDTSGNVPLVLDSKRGLGNNAPKGLFADDAQNLWVTLDQGVARVEWPSPLTKFAAAEGITGQVASLQRYRGTLYAATSLGLYRLVPGRKNARRVEKIRARFEKIPGTKLECFDLCGTDHGLLVANPSRGVLLYEEGKGLKQISSRSAHLLEPIDTEGDTILVATTEGLVFLVHHANEWKEIGEAPTGTRLYFNRMQREKPGIIWASTAMRGVFRIDVSSGAAHARITQYDSTDGLPSVPILLGYAHDRMRFISDSSLRYFDEANGRFVTDSGFASLFRPSPRYDPIEMRTDRFGRVWFQEANSGRIICGKKGDDGKYHTVSAPFARMSDTGIYTFYVDEDRVVWFGAENCVYRFDPTVKKSYHLPFRALIRQVRTDDHIWYHGELGLDSLEAPAIDYSHTPITFSFSGTYYGYPNNLYFYYRLIGKDTTWIGPSSNNLIVYRNLDEGEYRFEVMAENEEGTRSDIAAYRFSVLPPWYRTWWAYVLYLLAFGLVLGVARLWYHTRFLRRRSEELEQTVHDRTKEIENKSREIRRQAEELEHLDSIVRTVNRETMLPNVLDALLMQSLLFFPKADTALFVRRLMGSDMFKVEAAVGRHAGNIGNLEFSLRELVGAVDVSMERMQEGVYLLSGLGERIAERSGDASAADTRFMAMTIQRAHAIEGFLVMGSQDADSFGPMALQRLLRLKEHASSAVAKAGAIDELQHKNAELDKTNQRLISTQEQLVAQKKISALGELTAGIAHEIQNPLNFVNNFSDLSCELLEEFEQELQGVDPEQREALTKLMELVKANCRHIREHGRRATSIVSAMVMHSRSGNSTPDRIALNELIDEFVMLSYHGIRLQFPQFQLELQRNYDEGVGEVSVLAQDLSRAIVNICNNAWEAAILKAAEQGPGVVPTVHVRSLKIDGTIHILIRDNGPGIDAAVQERIFEPFFTTKRNSRNAGLGLSMSYDIVTQLHRGELTVRSESGKFTEFDIALPVNGD